MWQSFRAMWSLLSSVALLMLGIGLFNTFIGLRSTIEGFSVAVVGFMMSGYYAGLVAGTLWCGRLINRIGHIRAFATFCAVNATAIGMFPFVVHAPAWFLLRVVLGFNLAGLYMVAESWLNSKATLGNRGTLLSLYMMTSYLALGGGQFLLNAGDPAELDLFLITVMILTFALVPVAVTRATSPAPVEATRFGFRRLYEISPVSVIGCVISGLALGALYAMGPIYGQRIGLSVAEIARFMGVVSVSGLLLQVPLGRLSDRFDRRMVITGVALGSALAAAALVLLGPRSELTLLVLAAIYGSILATLYPLSIAYANDYIDARDMVAASGGLVLAYGVGAALGPMGGAAVMALAGASGLFVYSAAVCLLLVAFAVYRMQRRWWVPILPKDRFVALPEASTTPIATEADPRSEAIQEPLDLGTRAPFPETAEVLERTRRRWRTDGRDEAGR